MSSLKDKTILITGASRGIGRAIALRCAQEGANLIILGKTDVPHPKLEGTIHSVAKEVERAGGQALPLKVDVRFAEEVEKAVAMAVKQFNGIDVLINNAGAIVLSDIENTPIKKYDLMQQVNVRATYLMMQAVLPCLKKSSFAAHILNLSPPINLNPHWLAAYSAYTISKYGMSFLTIGAAEEFRKYNIAVNSLWPKTIIATAAIRMLMGKEGMQQARKPEIVADAAYAIITTPDMTLTGQTLLDEDILRTQGVTNFDRYAVNLQQPLCSDLFIDD